MKTLLVYLIIAVASIIAVNYFTSCNVVNKSRSVEKKSVDSTSVTSVDSSKLLRHESTSVKKETAVDSSSHKHINDKKLILTFETSSNGLDKGHINPYKYLIDGKSITTPNEVTSAVINDSNEDDSSESINHNNSDSVKVTSLDSSNIGKGETTSLHEQTKSVEKTKESKRTSPWFIGGIILLVAIAGYFIGKRFGFFK